MSFPSSPVNNQEVQVNGIIYVWNSTKGAWRRKPGVATGNMNDDLTFNGNIIANSGARSTSTTTGAIQVTRTGGIGVTGNVNAGAFYSNNYFYANGQPIIVETASTSNSSGNIAGGEAGQLVYQQAANVTSFVTNGDIGKILASNGPGNMPIWVTLEELATLNGSPYITQLIYPSGNVGASDAGGETVYAIGSGFKPGFTMSVNNAPVVSASYITSSNVAFVTNPTAIGNYPLTITNPNRKSYTYNYIEFIGAGFPYFLNPPGYLNFVAQNLFFNQYILVAGGYKPYNFQITSGSLPGAMTIDAGSGLIQGYAPSVTDPTSYNFTVQVTDAQGQVATRNFYILVTVPVLLSNQMSLSSVGSDYIRASDADSNVSIAHTMSLSSLGSDYIRASATLANSAVKTMTLSSAGSDFLRAADADVNVSIPHTMTLSSAGSDFLRAADADVNLAIAHTMTLSSTAYHVATPATPVSNVITSGTTWTVPADWTSTNIIEVWGGGGGGGKTTLGHASGGAGGGYSRLVNTSSLTPGQVVSITIGAGGYYVAPTATPGGTTTFGNLISATGGTTGDSSSGFMSETSGGIGIGGNVNYTGGKGGAFTANGDETNPGYDGAGDSTGGAGGGGAGTGINGNNGGSGAAGYGGAGGLQGGEIGNASTAGQAGTANTKGGGGGGANQYGYSAANAGAGGLPGGGGGGVYGSGGGNPGTGGAGQIRITYTPT